MKTGFLGLFIVILMLTTACGSDNPTPAQDHAMVALNIGIGVDPAFKSYTGETPASSAWVKVIQEQLNILVNIDWMVTYENIEQKLDLAIATNTLPDAMVVSEFQLNQMIKADELEDLTEAYQQYASPIMKTVLGSFVETSESNKMYALPSALPEDINLMWIRKDWLDRLGMRPPATLDELEQTMKAFVEQDPDGNGQEDTIGISVGADLYDDFTAGPGSFNLNPIFSAFDAYPGFWLQGKEGTPAYGSFMPEMKLALAKLREWYAKGYLDQEMGIRESPGEAVIQGKAGIFFAPVTGTEWTILEALKNNPRANWQAYALPLDGKGKFNAKVFHPNQSFLVVRKGYPHPEAVIKVMNFIMRNEFKYGVNFQPLRNPIAPRDTIAFTASVMRDVLSGTKTPSDFAYNIQYTHLDNDMHTMIKTKRPPYDLLDIKYWNTRDPNFKRAYVMLVGGRNLLDPNVHKVESAYPFLTQTAETQWKHLISAEMDTFTKIIMGVAPLAEYDRWAYEWNRNGGGRITLEIAELLKQE